MCAFVVLFLMGGALLCKNAEESERRLQEGVATNASESEDNSVALNLNSSYEKSQEVSPVSSDSEGNRVVQNPSTEQEEQKNVVVTNPTVAPVKLASSVLEDHGVAVEDTENLAVLYQYPIGIGSDEEQNFDGIQKQQDVVGKMTVETQWEEIQPENFFGRVLLYCIDENGLSSEPVEKEFLVDTSAPKVCFSNSKVRTAPYCMQVDVVDAGHIVSGIDKITCTINGEPYEITDLVAKECVRLNNAIKVSSKVGFSLFLDEVGTYDISVEVTDNAGNVTSEKMNVEVTKPELVAVYMPRNFKIHIDPQQLLEKEQIFSDDIILKNVSGFDVKVNVSEINVVVQDEVSEEGIRKDCNLYLINPDNG